MKILAPSFFLFACLTVHPLRASEASPEAWMEGAAKRLTAASTDLQTLVDFLADSNSPEAVAKVTSHLLAGYPQGVRLLVQTAPGTIRHFPQDAAPLLDNKLPGRLPERSITKEGETSLLVSYAGNASIQAAIGIPASVLFAGLLPSLEPLQGLAVFGPVGPAPMASFGHVPLVDDFEKRLRSSTKGSTIYKGPSGMVTAQWQPFDLAGTACLAVRFAETISTARMPSPPPEDAPTPPPPADPAPSLPAIANIPPAAPLSPTPSDSPSGPTPPSAPSTSPATPTTSPEPASVLPPADPVENTPEPSGLSGEWNGAYSDRIFRRVKAEPQRAADALFKVQARVSDSPDAFQIAFTFPDGTEVLSGTMIDHEIAIWSAPSPGKRQVLFTGTHDAARNSIRGTLHTSESGMILRRTLYLLRMEK
jgi:hypothetical protein